VISCLLNTLQTDPQHIILIEKCWAEKHVNMGKRKIKEKDKLTIAFFFLLIAGSCHALRVTNPKQALKWTQKTYISKQRKYKYFTS